MLAGAEELDCFASPSADDTGLARSAAFFDPPISRAPLISGVADRSIDDEPASDVGFGALGKGGRQVELVSAATEVEVELELPLT